MTEIERLKAEMDAADAAYEAAWNALYTALNPRAAHHAALATRDARNATLATRYAANQAYAAALAAQTKERGA